jgi:hypothetical protein
VAVTKDPIRRLVDKAPTPAVVWVAEAPGEGTAPAYSPDSTFEPAAPVQHPLVGAFSNAVDAALDGSASAIFTIHKDDMPANVRPDFSRLKTAGVEYVVDKVRRRYWRGQLNGYTLALRI